MIKADIFCVFRRNVTVLVFCFNRFSFRSLCNTNRAYKDRLLQFIFKDKEKLLSLYNALNSSHYTNSEDIEITTLEDVIYCKMKNDVSFIIDDRLSLFEHQSTYNPNMPLRGFLYFAKHFEKYIVESDVDIYGKKLIEIERQEKQELLRKLKALEDNK